MPGTKRAVIVLSPGSLAHRKTYPERLGVFTVEKEGRAWMAPKNRITVYRMAGSRPIRQGALTLVHANTDLPYSMAAGKSPARPTNAPSKSADPSPWEGPEVQVKRWQLSESLYEAEIQKGEGSTSSRQWFDLFLGISLLAVVLAFAVRVGATYLDSGS